MNEQSAKDIIRCSIRTIALFNQLVSDLQANLSNEEFVYQRKMIGNIMGQIGSELINPAIAVFPDLKINDAEQWRKAGALSEPSWIKNVNQ